MNSILKVQFIYRNKAGFETHRDLALKAEDADPVLS